MLLTSILTYGGLLAVLGGLVILVMTAFNPRLMLRSYPKAIKDSVAVQSPREKRQTLVGGIVFQLLFLGTPVLSTILLKQGYSNDFSFAVAYANAMGVLSIANIADLLIFDWLIFCAITPKFSVIPGTEGHPAYKDYGHHFRAFLRGIVITGIVSLVIALLVWLL